ncbi:uncharacterized protein LOC127864846 [Dreissena polymorpha]|uniref:uncharacterized protein LOC127864846 n=1 Tax=Dreissena polymorpha TaxID=45954 RepID=UPI0022645822|nr:uncharacterized protein LOC127864846 [Dreissena polymorpha]
MDFNRNTISTDNQDFRYDHCYFDDFSIGSSVSVTTCDNSDASWKISRRVVELDTLAESLSACSSCQVPMNLLNTVGSRDFGQACVLEIQCSNCGAINNVASGRKHDRVYDMNTKLALGIQRTVQEVRAGPTYCSNIEDQDVEVTTLPPPVPKPGQAGLDTTGKEFVFFDLETRGLERTSHIIQIAAVHSTGQFSTYVMPEKKMSLKASEITEVTVVGDSMLVKGHKVTAVPIKSALTSFITFLQKFSPEILVGHNIECI